MIDTLLAGDNLFFYFFVNIIFHLLTACLVFLLFKKIIKRRSIAFLLSLVFLIHPAISQAVAWLPGRNDTLLAFFSLLAILFFQKFSSSPKFKFLGLYSVFFFFALLTKETALFLPLLVIVYFFTLGKKDVAEKHDKIIVVLTSVFIGVIWYLLRSLAFLMLLNP
jgi:predicted membrane-bound mannosyltransferase